MKKPLYLIYCAYAVLMIAVCCNEVPNDSTDTGQDGSVSVIDSRVSDCGGFGSQKRGEQAVDTDGEKLIWEFDNHSGSLDLLHAGLILNCCGVHAIEALFENGVLTVFEDDQPDPAGGRCRCVCPFDFAVTLTGIKSGIVTVRIVLTVDDDTAERWIGEVDFNEESGVISITGSSG